MDRKTLALLLLCFSGTTIAEDRSAAEPAKPTAKAEAARVAEAEDKVVCRRETSAGTRFEKKTCRKASEWARIEEKAVEDFGKVRNRPVTCPDCRE